MFKSEYEANLELAKIAKSNGYAPRDFNIAGNLARESLRRHNALHGSTWAKLIAKLTRIFLG